MTRPLTSIGPINRSPRTEQTHPLTFRLREDAERRFGWPNTSPKAATPRHKKRLCR